MNTQNLKDKLQNDLEWLARTRDELRVQAQLGKAETRSELNRLESTWQRVQEEIRRLGEQAKAPAVELGGAARSLLDELAQGYARIKRELDDAGLNTVAARTISAFQAASEQRTGAQLQGALTDAERAASDTAFTRALGNVAAQLGGQADVRTVFANPVTKEGVTVIPVARAFGAFGGGAGAASGREGETPNGSGMGIGGAFSAAPVGFIEIDKRGARFRRIGSPVDSWFGVAGLALDVARRSGGWVIDTLKRRRGR
jgi:uncharacterized spore protein YtfJ